MDETVKVLAALAGAGPPWSWGSGQAGRAAAGRPWCGGPRHRRFGTDGREAAREARGAVQVGFGDFADVGVDGPFTLVYVVFSTFFGLQSQAEQVRCFRNVAARLAPDGAFVIEAFVPDQTRFTRGGSLECVRVETDLVMLGATRHDAVSQTLMSQYVKLTEGGIRLYPAQLRYAWPSELDLMAQLAGLRLRDRWANWRREPFTRPA